MPYLYILFQNSAKSDCCTYVYPDSGVGCCLHYKVLYKNPSPVCNSVVVNTYCIQMQGASFVYDTPVAL
jgi:hypothetical protein